MVAKKRCAQLREEGQALFEFVVFLPFLLFILVLMFTLGNAINGSINQQKAARRYFFYLNKGNSTLPNASNLRRICRRGAGVGGGGFGGLEGEGRCQ